MASDTEREFTAVRVVPRITQASSFKAVIKTGFLWFDIYFARNKIGASVKIVAVKNKNSFYRRAGPLAGQRSIPSASNASMAVGDYQSSPQLFTTLKSSQ